MVLRRLKWDKGGELIFEEQTSPRTYVEDRTSCSFLNSSLHEHDVWYAIQNYCQLQ